MRCWNCQAPDQESAFCSGCGHPVRPSRGEARGLEEKIFYLTRQVETWDWLSQEQRERVAQDYSARAERLAAAVEVPVLRLPARAEPEAPPPEPSGPSWAEVIANFLEERNVRWFHTLGTVLLLSAFVGYLRAEWDGPGRQLLALVMTLSPIACFALAARLKAVLPLSSRLLSVTGGLLLPTGLMALNHFGVAGLSVPASLWATFSLSVTAAVLLCQRELSCLYLGTLSIALAGFSAGLYLGNGPLALGLVSFATGLVYVGFGSNRHYRLLSLAMGALGVVASSPGLAERDQAAPLVLLVMGTAFFALTGYVYGEARALKGSAVVGAAGGVALVWLLDLPFESVGFATLALGLVYLGAARLCPELSEVSERLGLGLNATVLVVLFGGRLVQGAGDNFASVELQTSALLGLFAALYYGFCALRLAQPQLIYAAAGSLAYGFLLAVVELTGRQVSLYPLLLGGLALVLALVAPLVPKLHRRAVRESATALGVGLVGLTLGLQWLGLMGDAPFTFLILSLVGFASGWLWLAFPALVLAYAEVFSSAPAFVPVVYLLAGVAWKLGPVRGRAPGVVALLLALGFSTAQLLPEGSAFVLGTYVVGFAAASRLFSDWGIELFLAAASVLLLPGLGLVVSGWTGALALAVLALGTLLAPEPWPAAGRPGVLLWSALAVWQVPDALAMVPALIWLVAGWGRGALALFLLGAFEADSSVTVALFSAVMVLGFGRVFLRGRAEAAVWAWVAAAVGWAALLDLLHLHGVYGWLLFNVLVQAAALRFGGPLGSCSGVTAVFVLLGSYDLDGYGTGLVHLGYGAALWRRSAWLGFLVGYVGWCSILGSVGAEAIEWWTVPPALFLLSRSHSWLGQTVLITPALFLSVYDWGHASFVAVAGLGLLLAGVALRDRRLGLGGSAALVAEALVRVSQVAVLLPWQLVAGLIGVFLVLLGILVERRREDVRRLFSLVKG